MFSKTEKPAYLTDAEKEKVIGTEAGWVYQHPYGVNEIIVAMRGVTVTPEEPEVPEEPETPEGEG